MNSFNHYAYGAVGEWMYRVMAGIEIDESLPGYKHIFIQPRPGGGFTYVRASHESMYGKTSSSWRIDKDRFELEVEIPPNTTATIRLPGAEVALVEESGRAIIQGNGISRVAQDGDAVVLQIRSGQYRFSYPVKQ